MRENRPTSLELALLGLLHQETMSGYDLRKVFAETALGSYSSSPGAIYPALARLEKRRLVSGREDRSRRLRPKKLYRPTAAGRRAFADWLTRDVTREDVSRALDTLMLRFAFLGVLGRDEPTRRFLLALEREITAYLEELARQRELVPEAAPHARLALEAGIDQYRACARWARKALTRFEPDAD